MSYELSLKNGTAVTFADRTLFEVESATMQDGRFSVGETTAVSRAELRTLVMMSLGLTHRETGRFLHRSAATTTTQMKSTYLKLHTRTLAGTVGWGFRTGLFRVETPMTLSGCHPRFMRPYKITPPERDALELVSLGMSTQEIAEEQYKAVSTITSLLKTARHKFGNLESIAPAVTAGYLSGVLELPEFSEMIVDQKPPVAM